MFNSKLKKENRALREALELAQKEAVSCRNELLTRMGGISPYLLFSVKYTLTDSDYVNYSKESTRRNAAKQRMMMSLAYKLGKVFGVEDVVKDGVVVGYELNIEARKKSKPLFLQAQPLIDKYEAAWEEALATGESVAI